MLSVSLPTLTYPLAYKLYYVVIVFRFCVFISLLSATAPSPIRLNLHIGRRPVRKVINKIKEAAFQVFSETWSDSKLSSCSSSNSSQFDFS